MVSLAAFRQRRRAPAAADEPWVSKRKVAEHFGVSTRTIERWMDRGLPHDRPYGDRGHVRFKLGLCDDWAQRRRAAIG